MRRRRTCRPRGGGIPRPAVCPAWPGPGNKAAQLDWLEKLKVYAFRKHGRVEGHPELDQHPPAEGAAGSERGEA
jgi:hypothetical protein